MQIESNEEGTVDVLKLAVLKAFLGRTKTRKAPGMGGTSPELLKYDGT